MQNVGSRIGVPAILRVFSQAPRCGKLTTNSSCSAGGQGVLRQFAHTSSGTACSCTSISKAREFFMLTSPKKSYSRCPNSRPASLAALPRPPQLQHAGIARKPRSLPGVRVCCRDVQNCLQMFVDFRNFQFLFVDFRNFV